MGIYLFTFGYLCIFSIIEMMRKRIGPKAVRTGLYVFAFLILFFIAGFRYGLETDYWTYYHEFYGTSDTNRSIEFGFSLFMSCIRTLTNSYTVFVIVLAALMMLLKYIAFSKYKFQFSLLLIYYTRFFVQFDLNAVRQGLAIAIIFYALDEYKRNEIKKYIILILLASTIHSPAIILLVFLLLKKIKLSTAKVIVGIVVATIFRFYLLEKFIFAFSRFIPMILSSSISVVHHLVYILSNNTTSDAIAIASYLRVVLPAICLYYLTRKTQNEIFYKAYFIGAILNICFMGLDTIGYRLAAYFFVSEILIMGDLYNNVIPLRHGEAKVRFRKLIPLFVVVFCDMWTFFSLLSTSETLVPFTTIFTQ